MRHAEAKLFATEMAPAVAVLIDRATRPLLDRIDELERRSLSYAGVWARGTKYPANAMVTDAGATWLVDQRGPARRATWLQLGLAPDREVPPMRTGLPWTGLPWPLPRRLASGGVSKCSEASRGARPLGGFAAAMLVEGFLILAGLGS